MSEPIRVLFICHSHPDLVTGGTELFAHSLFRALAQGGQVQPLFLACVSSLHRNDRGLSRLQGTGAAVADEMLIRVGRFDRLMLAPIDAGAFVEAFSAVLCGFRPDIVHFHHFNLIGLDALLIVRRLLPQARIVATLHDYHLICTNDGLMVTADAQELCHAPTSDACHRCFPAIAPSRFAARDFYVRSLLDLVDRFLAPSETIRKKFLAWGLPPERVERMANAVPANEQTMDAAADDINETPTTFACFGNLAPHKGILVALKAARRLTGDAVQFRLHVHGRMQFQAPEFAQAFAAELESAGDAVFWHGGYRREEMAHFLHAADWVVVPSVWWENAPLVILEAFAAGRPVICSGIGGMAELVQNEVNGLHFRMGDEVDLARVMRRAATETGLWQRLRAHLPSVPHMQMAALSHLALYESLLPVERAMCV
jgi:glycosyltransferase involved in cell wall biosynthesis